jgi:hypothetical protein
MLIEIRQQAEAFLMLAREADAHSVGVELTSMMRDYAQGFRDQAASIERVRSLLALNPEGTWIDDGGLETRARVPVPPLTISAGRDGSFYMLAGGDGVATQSISYLVNSRLQRTGARLTGSIMVGYYIQSSRDNYACSSTGTVTLVMSDDGRVLSGTAALAQQPNSVPAPFVNLCTWLPNGTRTIRLTRQ